MKLIFIPILCVNSCILLHQQQNDGGTIAANNSSNDAATDSISAVDGNDSCIDTIYGGIIDSGQGNNPSWIGCFNVPNPNHNNCNDYCSSINKSCVNLCGESVRDPLLAYTNINGVSYLHSCLQDTTYYVLASMETNCNSAFITNGDQPTGPGEPTFQYAQCCCM